MVEESAALAVLRAPPSDLVRSGQAIRLLAAAARQLAEDRARIRGETALRAPSDDRMDALRYTFIDEATDIQDVDWERMRQRFEEGAVRIAEIGVRARGQILENLRLTQTAAISFAEQVREIKRFTSVRPFEIRDPYVMEHPPPARLPVETVLHDPRPLTADLAPIVAQTDRKREARKRAQRTLKAHLNPTQRRQWKRWGYFTVRGSLGGHYKIRQRRVSGVIELRPYPLSRRAHCIAPDAYLLPVEDIMLAQLLLIRADEARFRWISNAAPFPRRFPTSRARKRATRPTF